MEHRSRSYRISKRLAALIFLLFSGHLAVFGSIITAEAQQHSQDVIELVDIVVEPEGAPLPFLGNDQLDIFNQVFTSFLPNSFAATLGDLDRRIKLLLQDQNAQFLQHQPLRLILFRLHVVYGADQV